MKDYVAVASPVIALIALLYSRYSTRIARQSLELSRKTAQVSYEEATFSRAPSVNLFLEEIEYRRSDFETLESAEKRRFRPVADPDSIEVVIRGRLVNNLSQEILLTCRDHPKSGRTTWRPLENESVFYVGGEEVRLANAVLPADSETSIMWVDRRSREEWIEIYNLKNRGFSAGRERRVSGLNWREALCELLCRELRYWTTRNKVKRSGFDLICEPRTTERIATVWSAEIVRNPMEFTGRDESGRIVFGECIETVPGPLDDRTVYYRARFDSTLALVDVPKMRYLVGRQV